MFRITPILFRDEGGAGGTPPPAPQQVPPPNAGDFSAALAKALDERFPRVEKSVLKSMADQYGISEDEAKGALEKYKTEKAARIPDAAQKQIDEANARLQQYQLSAAVAREGASLGLLDPDVALQLIPADSVKVNDKGELTGVKEALEKLKTGKPYLFGATQKLSAMAQRVGGQPAGTMDGVEARFYAKNPGLKPQS